MKLNPEEMTEIKEVLLNEDQWKSEAAAVIKDIQEHVQNVEISRKIKCSNQRIYLNVTTIEGTQCCVELTSDGFRLVGNAHDDVTTPGNRFFETPYALLDQISPSYRVSFGNALMKKLGELQSEENNSE